jgi:hypothetical protein
MSKEHDYDENVALNISTERQRSNGSDISFTLESNSEDKRTAIRKVIKLDFILERLVIKIQCWSTYQTACPYDQSRYTTTLLLAPLSGARFP